MADDASAHLRFVPSEPPIGSWLREYITQGAPTTTLAPESLYERVPFIYSESIDAATARLARGFNDPAFRRVAVPEFMATKLANAVVVGDDGIVLHRASVIRDTLTDLAPWRHDSSVSTYRMGEEVRFKRDLPLTRKLSGEYLLGYGGGYRNYAHWIQQCLPRLWAYTVMRERIRDLRIVLPTFAPQSFQAQTVRLLGIGDAEIEPLGVGEAVEIEYVHLPSRIDLWSVSKVVAIAAAALAATVYPLRVASDRLYIRRQVEARRLANLEDLEGLLLAYGFKIVSFEQMALSEQIATMRSSNVVVAEHGAGLINILFCQKNSSVLELFNPRCVQPEFWSVASVCDYKYGFVVGDHVGPGEPEWNSSYRVPYDRMKRALDATIHRFSD
jgi:capsular polysaccharide biosynthesis protein